MKKLKGMFTTINANVVRGKSRVLEIRSLLIKKFLKFYHLKSLYFIL